LLLRKLLRRFPHFQREWDSDSKILRLLLCPLGKTGIGFRRVNEIETKDVVFAADARVETVAIVRWIWLVTAVRQSDPGAMRMSRRRA
jgi:hypothetical protein